MRLTRILAAVAAILAVALLAAQPKTSQAAEPHTTAFLGVYFQNDNEEYEPTSDAERNRIAMIEQIFKSKLAESGDYRFVEISPEMEAKIASGQSPGECGGCEVDYGEEIGTERVAWINVQKVSNLILNMNVYIADVSANKMVFIKSADMRNNSDKSWERSINYILDNYLLPDAS